MPISGATNVQINNILKKEFGSTAYTPPTTWYVVLSTTPIIAAGTGATEPAGGGYARVAVVNNTTNFVVNADTVTMQNGTVIQFPAAAANWGVITYIALYDAASAGTIRYYAQLTNTKTVETDDVLRIEVAQLKIQLIASV